MKVLSAPSYHPASRIGTVDMLRGFSLGGIYLVNITQMNVPWGLSAGPLDNTLVFVFVGKFYPLFSFLFGYSITLQIRSANRAGVPAKWRIIRRCTTLALIGIAHAVLLFTGDVLTVYGAAGVVLLLLSAMRARFVLTVAGLMYSVVIALSTILAVLGVSADEGHRTKSEMIGIIRTGGLPLILARWQEFTSHPFAHLQFALLVLPLFLVGLAAGKIRLLEDPVRYLPMLPRAQVIGLGLGAPLTLAAMLIHKPWVVALFMVASPLLTMAYAATLLRLAHSRYALVTIFAPAGRVAATNYIAQSLIGAILFTGYGFALAGRLPEVLLVGTAVVIYAIQLGVSAWYVRRFQHGPIEWVLRLFTYGLAGAKGTSVPTGTGPS
ncbi:DUF418 domain-containing protein [Nocardia vinacea]|uniref:DUF418 domain-containing protein n=1 Tax=Nocardia vinacea TaxID=96468 RepID=UPI002E118CC9|nr:DUF418 domain-containing protein [Nocardia vinacea]